MSALARLAAGDLDGWTGLPRGLTRSAVEASLGAAVPDRDLGGHFAGEPRVRRRYAPTDAAPGGIDVWFGSAGAVAVEYAPARVSVDTLGEPEASLERGLSRRLVYASRGLAVDVAPDGGTERVLGFTPCSASEFLAGPLGTPIRVDRR
jgi:hypothetical protein